MLSFDENVVDTPIRVATKKTLVKTFATPLLQKSTNTPSLFKTAKKPTIQKSALQKPTIQKKTVESEPDIEYAPTSKPKFEQDDDWEDFDFKSIKFKLPTALKLVDIPDINEDESEFTPEPMPEFDPLHDILLELEV